MSVCGDVGKVFFREREVWRFDLLRTRRAPSSTCSSTCRRLSVRAGAPETQYRPALEKQVAGVAQTDAVDLTIETPEGPYAARRLARCLRRRALIVRKLIGQESHGRIFRDRFLIAGVRWKADFPTGRWFLVRSRFIPNQSVLLHRQRTRLTHRLPAGRNADPVEAVKPEKRAAAHSRAAWRPDAQFDLEWSRVYTFACERMGSSATAALCSRATPRIAYRRLVRVAPTAACRRREPGAELSWCLRAWRPKTLIGSCSRARVRGRREHLNSSRATDFITPKSDIWPPAFAAPCELAKDASVCTVAGQQRPLVTGHLHRVAVERTGCRRLYRPHGARRGRAGCAGVGGWRRLVDGAAGPAAVLAVFCNYLPDRDAVGLAGAAHGPECRSRRCWWSTTMRWRDCRRICRWWPTAKAAGQALRRSPAPPGRPTSIAALARL